MSCPSAPTKRCINIFYKCKQKPPPQTQPRWDNENKTRTQPTRAPTKKKTQRGGDLGEGESEDVRVELVVRGQVGDNTRGNPNPKRGLGFPSAWEKEEESKRRRRTDQTKKEREREKEKDDNKQYFWQGSGLKVHKTKQYTFPGEKHRTEKPT